MKNNHRFKLDVWGFMTLGIILLYAFFLIAPVGYLMIKSIWNGHTITFTYFTKFFSKSYYFETLLNSLKVSLLATFTALCLGAPMAYFFRMYQVRGKKLLQILIIIASMSAPFIGAYSWVLLMGRNGVLTDLIAKIGIHLPPIYGLHGIVLVFTLQLFPLVFLYVNGALKNVDNSLIEASEQMGCAGFKRFMKVILPLIAPTMFAAGLLVFMRALADFGTPMLIGEGFRTFPVLIYTEFVGELGGDDGFAAAISVIAIVITLLVFIVQKFYSERKSFTMNSLHPIEAKPMKRKTSIFVHIFCYGFVGLAVLPQCYVIYTSFLKTNGLVFLQGFSLDSYRELFSTLASSITNTIVIPLTALVFIILFAILIAYLAVRRKNILTSFVDLISMIPYIVPGIVVGIALLLYFTHKPLGLSIVGTMAIMVIALIIRRLPYTIRSSVAILQQIPMNIEEAALSLGSNKLKTFFRITVPMMSSGIIAGAILSWVTMISELSTAIILYTTRTQTLTVSVYTQVIRGNYGVAAALSAVLTCLTILSLLIFMKVSKGKDMSL